MQRAAKIGQAPQGSNCSSLNQALMELGALICTPKAPQCSRCPVLKFCVAHRQNRVGLLPNLGQRQRQIARRFIAFVAENRGRYLLRQRPSGVVNAGLWEFPNVEVTAGNGSIDNVGRRFLCVASLRCEPLITIKHTITRYRITLEAFRVREIVGQRPLAGRWLNRKQLAALPLPSAHRKIASCLPS